MLVRVGVREAEADWRGVLDERVVERRGLGREREQSSTVRSGMRAGGTGGMFGASKRRTLRSAGGANGRVKTSSA